MKYGDLDLVPLEPPIIKVSKTVDVLKYPRVHGAESRLASLNATTIMCTLVCRTPEDHDALMLLHASHAKQRLYVDGHQPGSNRRYYDQVSVTIGETIRRGRVQTLLATFSADDPGCYDTATGRRLY